MVLFMDSSCHIKVDKSRINCVVVTPLELDYATPIADYFTS